MTYALQDAIDMLDSIAAGITPGRAAVVHGAVTLALHIKPDDVELVALVYELEQYILGKVDRLSAETSDRAGPMASRLRRVQGVH